MYHQKFSGGIRIPERTFEYAVLTYPNEKISSCRCAFSTRIYQAKKKMATAGWQLKRHFQIRSKRMNTSIREISIHSIEFRDLNHPNQFHLDTKKSFRGKRYVNNNTLGLRNFTKELV